MKGAGDDLLAGAALAGDEHGRLGVAEAGEELVDLAHRGAVAKERVVAWAFGGLGAKALHLLVQSTMGGRALDRDREDVLFDGLADEVVRTRTDRGDGGVEAAKRGDDDDGNPRALVRHAPA